MTCQTQAEQEPNKAERGDWTQEEMRQGKKAENRMKHGTSWGVPSGPSKDTASHARSRGSKSGTSFPKPPQNLPESWLLL